MFSTDGSYLPLCQAVYRLFGQSRLFFERILRYAEMLQKKIELLIERRVLNVRSS